MTQEEVRYYEVYENANDKKAGVNPIKIVAVMFNKFQRITKSYKFNSGNTYGYKAIFHELKKGKIALDFISANVITKECNPIPVEKVDYLLIDVVNNLK